MSLDGDTMKLRFSKADGTQGDFSVSEKPITIGRSAEADIVVMDEKASRIHCGVRLWDGDFYVRDLKSRNGTFVNEQRVEVAKLRQGDRIRIGSTMFMFEQDALPDATPLQAMADEMAQGKGYSTILREIVHTIDSPRGGAIPGPRRSAHNGQK